MKDRIELELDGVRISCAVGGTPDAPPLVLVHGGNCDASTWGAIAAQFSSEYRIYAPDLRGHGQSQWTDEYSYELFGDDLARLGEALGLKDATVVGHSLGGLAVLLAAQRHAPWLGRLVVEDTMLRRDPTSLPPPASRPVDATCDWDGIVPSLHRQVENPPATWWTALPAIDVPTLLVLGDTRTTAQQLALEASKIIPRNRVRVMDTGHFVHREKPAEYVTELRSFFDAAARGDGGMVTPMG